MRFHLLGYGLALGVAHVPLAVEMPPTATLPPVLRPVPPTTETFVLTSRVFQNTRTIHIMLPPGYRDPAHARRRYPVLYFTDGVAAFDAAGWGVTVVAESLWQAGSPAAIIVGIDNGGSTRESEHPQVDRASEYLPYPDPSWTEAPIPEPRGNRFPAFLFDEVMPAIAGRYRVSGRPEDTGLAGSSFGGAIALYTVMQRPGRIGRLLLESPSLHVGQGRLLADAVTFGAWPARIHLGVGDAEGDDAAAQREMAANVARLLTILRRAPSAPAVHAVQVPGAIHWYSAWRERLPEALEFLLAAP